MIGVAAVGGLVALVPLVLTWIGWWDERPPRPPDCSTALACFASLVAALEEADETALRQVCTTEGFRSFEPVPGTLTTAGQRESFWKGIAKDIRQPVHWRKERENLWIAECQPHRDLFLQVVLQRQEDLGPWRVAFLIPSM